MKRFTYLAGAIAVLLLLALVLLHDTVVIEAGIRTWRMLMLLSGALLILCTVAAIALTARSALQEREQVRDAAEREEQERERAESERDEARFLSSKRDMDPDRLRRELVAHAGDWRGCEEQIRDLADQFSEMDGLQERLERLIRQNGDVAFTEATGLFSRMEQNICKNARSCLNLMTVSDEGDETAQERLRERLDAAITDNSESLERARTVMAEQVRLLDAATTDDSDELADIYLDAIRRETELKKEEAQW